MYLNTPHKLRAIASEYRWWPNTDALLYVCCICMYVCMYVRSYVYVATCVLMYM